MLRFAPLLLAHHVFSVGAISTATATADVFVWPTTHPHGASTALTEAQLQETLDSLTEEQKIQFLAGVQKEGGGLQDYVGIIDWRRAKPGLKKDFPEVGQQRTLQAPRAATKITKVDLFVTRTAT